MCILNTFQRKIALPACLFGLLAAVGCGLLPPMALPQEIPPEIAAVVEHRESARVMEDDPFFDAEAGLVVEDLSGLDGCWASYLPITSPGNTPFFPAGTHFFDQYEFFRIDFDTGEMTYQAYGELTVASYANVVSYNGTFTIAGDNRLHFAVETFTYCDPLTGELLTFPASLESLLQDADLDEEAREEIRAEFEADMIWEYLVTLDGDRVKLVPVWEDEETGVDVVDEDETHVCVRFECPE